jgi:hypothetical protein
MKRANKGKTTIFGKEKQYGRVMLQKRHAIWAAAGKENHECRIHAS